VRADQCHACGLCVAACPEKAIRLVPALSPS
jgi:NAD-dependent dihydropyrimidine dehydrogenase PreA subunit